MRYATSDLANTVGVSTNTIRRYEECGFISSSRGANNYREFDYFEAIRAAQVRLYGKNNFSNEEIMQMVNQTDEKILSIYDKKIDSIDKQIQYLSNCKKWIEDMKALMNTAEHLQQEFIIGKTTPFRYICFRKEFEQLNEPERREAMKAFIWKFPNAYIVNIGKRSYENPNEFVQFSAWAIKEENIDEFGLRELVETSDYIEEYPEQDCLFLCYRIPADLCNDVEQVMKFFAPIWEKSYNFLRKQNYEPAGDLMQIYLSTLGDEVVLLDSLPVKKIE